MNEPTLVILAAGMGSRYGGLKQIDPMGHHGEIIMDYSVYDAVRAGFKRVLLLIAPGMKDDFDAAIGSRIASQVETLYAYQEPERFLPEGFALPPERKKPWGTGHAVLCCREALGDCNFAMINADDYYGPHAFRQIYEALCKADPKAEVMDFSMVGYYLKNTVTEHGKVARGLCRTEDGWLREVIERTYVVKTPEGPAYSLDGGETLIHTEPGCVASMNFWGFTPAIFDVLERRFPQFIREDIAKNPNEELYIPNVVGELLKEGKCRVRMMNSEDKWYGVTYKQDKPEVMAAITRFIDEGRYPEKLWG